VSVALNLLAYAVIAGVLLSMVRQVSRPGWMYHPVVNRLISFTDALCSPIRRLMERYGVPTRPLDFSPMVVVLLIQLLAGLVLQGPWAR